MASSRQVDKGKETPNSPSVIILFYTTETSNQGGSGIAKKECGSVLSKVALGAELTTYVSIDLAFFGKIRLDSQDNTCTNIPILVLIYEHVLDV